MALAETLEEYRYENSIVVALSDGAVLVAEPIAAELHCILTIMLAEDVMLPGEPVPIGSINQEGGFAYNSALSDGEVDEIRAEFHGYIESQKLEHLSHLHQLLGETGVVAKEMLRDQIVIVVADGLKNASTLDAVAEFLKPVRVQKLVIVTPIASVESVDRMHIVADEIHILSTTDNYLDTNHYYDDNTIPGREEILAKMKQIILNWH